MTSNEIALVVFLFFLITVWSFLPRLGEWLGSVFGGNSTDRQH